MATNQSRGSLPPYTVRVSARARRIRLTVTAREGLVVVVPEGMSVDADSIVASKQLWARRSLAALTEKRSQHVGGPSALMPQRIELRAQGSVLDVLHSIDPHASRVRVRESGDSLFVTGPDDDSSRIDALSAWLSRRAHAWLPQRLEDLARSHDLSYSRVRITRARSRWGSCSSQGTISLNSTLMFLPPELVDALILHELAHTRELNHSNRFWEYLGSLDPRTLEHRRALKSAGEFVPAWAEA